MNDNDQNHFNRPV